METVARRSGWADELDGAVAGARARIIQASPATSSTGSPRRREDPPRLRRVIAQDPAVQLDAVLRAARACGGAAEIEVGERRLRDLKSELHLLTALADLGSVWRLEEVTAALSRFADAALASAMCLAAGEALAAGRLTRLGEGDEDHVARPVLRRHGQAWRIRAQLTPATSISLVFYAGETRSLCARWRPAIEPAAHIVAAIRFVERVAGSILQETDRRRVCLSGSIFACVRTLPPPACRRAAGRGVRILRERRSELGTRRLPSKARQRRSPAILDRGRAFLTAFVAVHLAAQPRFWKAIADIHSHI